MGFTIWAAVVALAGLGGWWYWRMRRRRKSRFISLVALLREPMMFDPVVLAKTAGKGDPDLDQALSTMSPEDKAKASAAVRKWLGTK